MRAKEHIAAASAFFLSLLLSAALWFGLLAVAGASLIVAGVYLLAGLGWSLVVCGFCLVVVAALIGRGMGSNG